MYLHRFYFLSIGLTVGVLFCMDVEEKPTFAVLDGIRLAHQFYKKRDLHQKQDPCFSALPSEIQGRITAQAHPRQTVDAYVSDNLICVGEKKLPYKLLNFNLQHDSLVYFSVQQQEDLMCVLGHLNLNNFSYHEVRRVKCDRGEAPQLALCGSKIVYKPFLDVMCVVSKNSIDGSDTPACLKEVDKPHYIRNFACHSILPLCISIDTNHVLYLHNIETHELILKEDLNFYMKKTSSSYPIVWHHTEAIYVGSHNKHLFYKDLTRSKNQIYAAAYYDDYFSSTGTSYPFLGTPKISYIGSRAYGQAGLKLKNAVIFVSRLEKHMHIYENRSIENASLESVGDEYILTRDNTTHVCSLQSLHDDTKKVIKSLNGLKGKLHKLPDNHDYRLFVIDEVTDPTDTSQISSVIKIFVPNSRACMAHYCLFNAALEAEKTDRAVDWNLFKKADPRLLQQTAEHYPYFKKLMIEKRMLQ